MGNFSIDPQQNVKLSRQKGYVGVRIEQGVPVLDRDLNLLGDVISATVRELVERFIGSGNAPGDDGFSIEPITTGTTVDLKIGAGSYLVGGLLVTSTGQLYSSQFNVPPIVPPTGFNSRNDVVYLDVWLAEVDEQKDATLSNAGDVRMQTSVRVKPVWVVRVATGVEQLPPAPEGHVHALLADLMFGDGQTRISDRRTRSLSLSDCLRRLTVLEQALRPMLVPGDQFDTQKSWVGQTVRLNGSGLNVGHVQVTLTNLANVTKQASLVGTPLVHQLAIRIPSDISGTCKATITTGLGTVATTDTLFLYGPPSFKTGSGQIVPTSTPYTPSGAVVTLNGNNFFEGPNLRVFFGTTVTPTANVQVLSATQLKVTVPNIATNTSHVISVKTDASPTAAVSTETFTLTIAK